MTRAQRRTRRRAIRSAATVAGVVCITALTGCGTERDPSASGVGAPAPVAESYEARALIDSIQARFTVAASDDSGARVPVLAPSNATRFVHQGSQVVPRIDESAKRGVLHVASVTLPARASGVMRVVDETSKMTIQVSIEDAADAEAEAVDGYLVYRNALRSVAGSSVVQRVTAEGVEDYVSLQTAPPDAAVDYRVELADGVVGLRLVSNALEFLDDHGVPRLRVSPPYLVDATGTRHRARIEVLGCQVDTDSAPPMDRPTTDPGSGSCGVRIAWAQGAVAYPALLDPGWTATGNMVALRVGSGSVKLPDGRILVAGGYDAAAYDTSELFDPATKTWSASGTLAAGRSAYPPMAVFGTTALIAGGDSVPTSAAYTSEEWSNGVWSHKTTMEVKGTYARALTPYGTTVMLVGGYGGPLPLSPVDRAETAIYNVATHGWWSAASLKTARSTAVATLLQDGRVLVTGGSNNATALDTAEVYDGTAWTLLSSKMSAKRSGHFAGVLADGRVLVALGSTTKVDIFDPQTATFSPTFDLPGLASGSSRGMVLANRRVAIAGGNAAETYAFLPGEDAGWVNVGSVITPRSAPILFPLSTGGQAVFAGGGYPTEVLTLWPNGAAKSTGQHCISGYSSDNVCCDVACNGGCDTCTGGTCSRITGAGSPSCTPYLCTGATSACPTSCTADSACIPSHYCTGSACQPKKSNGQGCSANNQCTSNYCVDGVCCNSACGGACDVCNATPGTCTVVADGTPAASCAPYLCNGTIGTCPTTCVATADCSAGYSCVAGKCQQQGQGTACTGAGDCGGSFPFCVDSVCCSTACSGGCERCDVSGLEGLCNVEPAGTPPTGCSASSQPYLCAGGSGGCPTACAADSNCISGYYCSGAICLPRKSLGTGCTAGTECQSGKCVDAVCCDTACSGPCDQCNKSGSAGTCTPTGSGTAGDPSCAPFKCGAGATCAATCAKDADCTPGFFCSAGSTCEPQLGLGAPCATTAECTGALVCADQVCCDSDCTGSCKSCLASKKGEGVDGMCGFILSGSDPDSECTASDSSTCGLTGQCDGNGTCAHHPLGTPCGSVTTCSKGSETRYQCNGLGACDASETVVCSPYACDGATCADSCIDDSLCSDTTFCATSTHTCVPKLGLGATCTAQSECGSGQCADGVCCDKACTGQCYACSQAAKGHGDDGVCEPIGAGTADDAQPCQQDAVSTCGKNGMCNGSGACAYYAPGTACKGTASCVGGSAVGFVCNTFNECVQDTAGIDCSPYLCKDGPGCGSSCALDADCIAEHFCDAGQCMPKRTPGEACAKDAACKSGTCVDGVCCTSACDGSCELCNLPNAQNTVDGVCKVVVASTTPAGNHAPCSGQAGEVCSGYCDGSSAECVYPGNSTSCPGSSCTGNVAQPKACDGLGSCAAQASVDCAAYGCDNAAGECKSSCLSANDCAPGAACNQATGVCAVITNTCVDEFTSESTDGKKTSCAPYKCSGGVCAQACTTSADCATGFGCQGTKCVEESSGNPDSGTGGSTGGPGPSGVESSGDSGGCAVATGSPRRPWLAALLGAIALAGLVRRRRSRGDDRSPE